jgi:chaperonin GroES
MIPTPAPDPSDATTSIVAAQPRVPFRPRGNRILIEPDRRQRPMIVVPDQAQESDRHWAGLLVRTAKVIAVGPGLYVTYRGWKGYRDEEGIARWPMHDLRPGDRILYRAWSGHDVVILGKKYEVIISNCVDAKILEDGRLDLIEDRLLVRRRPPIERTKGGLWIPDIAKKSSLEGEVVQTGPGKIVTNGTIMPMGVELDDNVAWRPMKGVNVSKFVPDLTLKYIDRDGVLSQERHEVVLLFETDLIGVIESEHFEPVVSTMKEQ